MSDRNDETQLNNDELAEVRSLIGDADNGGLTLDEIMAEYGPSPRSTFTSPHQEKDRAPSGDGAEPPERPQSGSPSRTYADLPWPEPPRTRTAADVNNVVAFPGVRQAEDEGDDPEDDLDEEPDEDLDAPDTTEDEEPEEDAEDPEDSEEEEEGTSNLLRFPPQPQPGWRGRVQFLRQKADAFAGRMFENKFDTPEARRLEKLIPGTDEEAHTPPPSRLSGFRIKLPHLPEQPTPADCSPYELFRTVSKERKNLLGRSNLILFLTLAALVQLLLPLPLLGQMGFFGHPRVQVMLAVCLMAGGLLAARELLLDSLHQARSGFFGPTLMTGLAGLCTLLDGVVLMAVPGPVTRMPFSVVVLAGLYFTVHGAWHRKLGVRQSCRTAAAASEPFRVTLDARKWNGQDTYAKWMGDHTGFSAQMQTMDGASQIFCCICPFLLAADLILAALNTLISRNPAQLFWALSAMLTATTAFGSCLVYARPFHKIAVRLAKSGAALAGWPGVESADKGNRVLLTDNDLFPTGYVSMNGYKFLNGYAGERVLAYTATLLRDAGCGLEKPFHDALRAVGGRFRTADHLWYYEGGGMSANIRGDRVLVGCAAFMTLQEVELPDPQDMDITDGVFCAINGDLAGIFALNYSLPETVFPAVEELLENQVNPVLATRDFNIIPGLLQRRFQLEADRMDFPPVARRRELSALEQGHSATLTGLLCREGLAPFAETICAAKRLRRATLLGTLLCCASSGLGLLLTGYLTSVSAFSSLSPLSLLVYMLTWLLPVWFLSSWAHRY